jgi:D-glycero-alpha-D-manno-heptose-7-phosphate kinase
MIIVQTPLRISFLGGGTDFEDFYINHGGAVLNTAIDKYIFVIVKKRFDDLICVNYSKRERVNKVEKLKHNLVKEALIKTGISKGIEITTLADIPSKGTGLGSSSSVTVGLLHALYSYKGELKTEEDLAREACQIEIDTLKNPIGKQDQYIGAYGNLRFMTFDSGGVNVETVQISVDEKRRRNHCFLLFYTGITRKSESVLTEQKANINQQIDVLIKMRDLSYQAKEAVLRGDFDEFGELLHEGWEYKKMLASNVTNVDINEIYKTARRAGAIGGKITGAGGGGFLLLYCRNGKQERVRKAPKGLRELPFNFEQDGSKVIFNYRRS